MGSLSLLNNLFKITIICTSTVIVVGTIVFTKEVLCEGLTSEKKDDLKLITIHLI